MAIYCNTLEGNMQYGDDPYCFTPTSYPSIPEINITLQGVTNLLCNCNLYKSPGPDGSNAAFKTCQN